MSFDLGSSLHPNCVYVASILNAVTPHVGIIMGSDSDLPVMKDAARILNMFGVPYEVDH